MTNSKTKSNVRMSNAKEFEAAVSKAYNALRLPTEFSRRSRPIDHAVFKAQEWKSLILCGLPILVRESFTHQTPMVANIWALFGFLVRVYLLPDDLFEQFPRRYLTDLHKAFYDKYEEQFGKSNCTFNTHSFSHSLQTRDSGSYSDLSTEAFESSYGFLQDSYAPGTMSVGKQGLVNMLIRYINHNDECDREFHLSPDKGSHFRDDSLIATQNFKFYKILSVSHSYVTAVKLLTRNWFCPGMEDIPFDKVGVYKFIEQTDETCVLKKKEIIAKAVLVDDNVILAITYDACYVA